jgi:hypothetical protein
MACNGFVVLDVRVSLSLMVNIGLPRQLFNSVFGISESRPLTSKWVEPGLKNLVDILEGEALYGSLIVSKSSVSQRQEFDRRPTLVSGRKKNVKTSAEMEMPPNTQPVPNLRLAIM